VAQAVVRGDRDGDLWVVTRGAQRVSDESVDPVEAPLWGFGRVVAVEHPEHWGGLIDLPLHADAAAAAELVEIVRSPGLDDQFAVRDGLRMVPRLVRRQAVASAAAELRSSGAYLVTGGLGGLGLQLTRWLAAGGAGTIVLTGRNGMPPRSEWGTAQPGSRVAQQIDAIRTAEASGASVEVVVADVAEAATMTALFRRFGDDLPPLAGVVHAAAALGNASTATMTAHDVETMFRPKVAGALLLHELTSELALDFFVMFSSTSALWGSRELGHYAAANQFLDAMAHYRHSLGLPALTVDWGTWDEMRVASADDRAEVAHAGMNQMPSLDALAVLGDLLAHPELAQVVVASVDWSVLKPVYEARRPRPFLSMVAPPSGAARPGRTAHDAPPELAMRLAELEGESRRELVVDFLREEVARALGIAETLAVDVEQGLFEMGMDSLMSVELKTRIEIGVGANLPSTLTFNYPNIVALAGYVVTEVLPESTASHTTSDTISDTTPAPDSASAVEATGLDASEDELAAMLASRLAKLQ
jgi:myxalamid-type polyketide synthase MxaE and MxaD